MIEASRKPAPLEHPLAADKVFEQVWLQVDGAHPRHEGQRERWLVPKLGDPVHELHGKVEGVRLAPSAAATTTTTAEVSHSSARQPPEAGARAEHDDDCLTLR